MLFDGDWLCSALDLARAYRRRLVVNGYYYARCPCLKGSSRTIPRLHSHSIGYLERLILPMPILKLCTACTPMAALVILLTGKYVGIGDASGI
jgi:hypothetical protein